MNEKIGIVVSDFNADITHLMLKVAEEHIKFLGGEITKVIRVPGAFEIPLGVKSLLGQVDGVATLGAVVEGATDHDKIIASTVAKKITDLSLECGKPVSLGVSGPKMTRADAMKRSEGYAKRSVESVFKMLRMKE